LSSFKEVIMKITALPEQIVLQKLLRYNQETGTVLWNHRSLGEFVPTAARTREWQQKWWNKRFADTTVGSLSDEGYLCARIMGNTYKVHRLIWKLVHGEDPDFVDHINGDRADNRLCNLRSVSRGENAKNVATRDNKSDAVLGVSLRNGRWRARISDSGKLIQLGTFDTMAEAVAARRAAEVALDYHPNHGRKNHSTSE
jgi:hypothetical protein